MVTLSRLFIHPVKSMRGMGLTHAGVIALDVLVAEGPMTQTMLARNVRVQAQTIGRR